MEKKLLQTDTLTIVCLFFLEKVQEKRPGSRNLLHHYNAQPHTARQATNYLGRLSIEILAHMPYSPGLAPCDFCLFPNVIEKNQEKQFTYAEEVVATYERAVKTTPKCE
ncbi:Mariner Mos1 transposase [Eumeta japonica]|uniref:Mariner Mos1 transposase n=1 Tax=Eumeta variegata TaxID=151549 RepID=A0A4C1SFY3_EUMVA|nr:Mariner Mos1 transposase [Eumeta japonica]